MLGDGVAGRTRFMIGLRVTEGGAGDRGRGGGGGGGGEAASEGKGQPRRMTGQCVEMRMYDEWGDGWDGAVYTVTDSAGEVVASGTLKTGATGTDELCGLTSGCYGVTVSAGDYPNEISWELTKGEVVLAEGGAPETVDDVCVELTPTSTPTTTLQPTVTMVPTREGERVCGSCTSLGMACACGASTRPLLTLYRLSFLAPPLSPPHRLHVREQV